MTIGEKMVWAAAFSAALKEWTTCSARSDVASLEAAIRVAHRHVMAARSIDWQIQGDAARMAEEMLK